MTLEEIHPQEENTDSSDSAGRVLEEVLVSSIQQDCLTVGVYESAKVMNLDPDSVALCVLASGEQYEWDVALQIHFTLIQSFCFDNDVNIVRVTDMARLVHIVSASGTSDGGDAHCILVTRPGEAAWKDDGLEKLGAFCEERRSVCDWFPTVTLPER
ncbi:growth arrest and DNA-damage-inducible, gamma a isoform 1-T3 [Clarias gariepinus]|uniref:growth arrest and DNA-damage-inducible, gamma a n=1 Tax=Clarias gariepinus TaxID=13013 RepID=UPI00234E0681|nr:growth arrest and DNA-damage-inducible, gamma a [Clarias gariepinus]XP_053359346.1 growth arrest and DNA-damage-inducible, gamma a [Clarias gariepinus]XP_053359347.1 growth arrest and DNA-damage-inducible, gamma a [Clarias gariepinus]